MLDWLVRCNCSPLIVEAKWRREFANLRIGAVRRSLATKHKTIDNTNDRGWRSISANKSATQLIINSLVPIEARSNILRGMSAHRLCTSLAALEVMGEPGYVTGSLRASCQLQVGSEYAKRGMAWLL